MSSVCLKFLTMGLCTAGTLLLVIAFGLPMWTVTAITKNTIVTSVTSQQGLWMSCAVPTTGQMRCRHYEVFIGHDMNAQRALAVISVALSIAALTVTVAGAQYTNCVRDESTKGRLVRAGGVLYIVSAVVVFMPLCWAAVSVTREFHSPHVKRKIGAAIYIGWAAAALLLLGGTLLCFSSGCLWLKSAYPIRYVRTSDKDKIICVTSQEGKTF